MGGGGGGRGDGVGGVDVDGCGWRKVDGVVEACTTGAASGRGVAREGREGLWSRRLTFCPRTTLADDASHSSRRVPSFIGGTVGFASAGPEPEPELVDCTSLAYHFDLDINDTTCGV